MKTNILLAADVAAGDPLRHVAAAVDMARDLVRSDADRVIVLHVREYSIARLVRTMRDGGGRSGRLLVNEIVSRLRAEGIHASAIIREADVGHIAETILNVAHEFDARMIVLGSRTETDLPRLPFGDAATHLLHLSTLPVLIVPSSGEPASRHAPRRVGWLRADRAV